jgi:hypothetical protein
MARHRPSKASEGKGGSVHDAAVTLGKYGGHYGGEARANKLSNAEKHRIAKMGGEARGRQESHTGKKGQSTLNGQAKKAANEPLHPQGPPNGQYGGRQPITGPPRGQNPPLIDQETPRAAEAYGHAPANVQDLLAHLDVPRPRNAPRLPQEPVGDIRSAFGPALAAMGRRKIG